MNFKRLNPLACLALLVSCQAPPPGPAPLLNPRAPEMNRRAPDRFEARLETTRGNILIEVRRAWSPRGADRFYNLVRGGYYDGAAFFRVIRGKWAQFGIAGDPKISAAWRNATIPDDPRVLSNTRGTVAFAFAVPNGRTTQVFINLRDNSATHDSEPFVPFGKIVQGMDVADALNAEYGELAGGGIRAGRQGPLFEGGNAYLKQTFPRLDYIKRATIASSRALLAFGVPVQLELGQVSPKTVRIQLAPFDAGGHAPGQMPSPDLVRFRERRNWRLRELASPKVFQAGDLRVKVTPRPLEISIRRPDGTLVQDLDFEDNGPPEAMRFRTGGPVLGLGEGAEQFDRRGAIYPPINGERYRLAEFGARVFSPFLIGTEGWALFIPSPDGGFDLRGRRGMFMPQKGARPGSADLFVIDARHPPDAMREFVRLTGAPALPPKWALGYMQSHRTLSSEADILAEARTFREKKLPCDAFIFLGTGFCPRGWNLGHDSFQFNTNVFPRGGAPFIRDLHADHFHVVLHVVPPERKYPALHGHIPPVAGEVLDREHIANYWKRHETLMADGVDGWWPDEGDWLDEPSRLARHRMYYQGPLGDRPNVRPWNLQRNGAPGMARFGGWIWSGDVQSSWKTLAAQVQVGLNSSLSLSPFWGSDIGGFYPGTNGEFTGELYARWFEFAAFCPSFRSHGRNWWLHRPWGWNTGEVGPVEARPLPGPTQLHNAAVEPVCRKYLDLRYQLMPYTYSITRQAHDTGLPLMRALWLEYPGDPEAAARGDEYLWGRDLLIAPVTQEGARVRRLYLPEGDWFDWWTGRKISGKRWIERPVDLATMPIYVRAGAILPLDPTRQYVSEPVNEPTRLEIFPGANGEFTLYDDDGRSLGYLSGKGCIWIDFKWDDARQRLRIEPARRMKKWPGATRVFTVEKAGAGAKPRRIEFGGTPVDVNL